MHTEAKHENIQGILEKFNHAENKVNAELLCKYLQIRTEQNVNASTSVFLKY